MTLTTIITVLTIITIARTQKAMGCMSARSCLHCACWYIVTERTQILVQGLWHCQPKSNISVYCQRMWGRRQTALMLKLLTVLIVVSFCWISEALFRVRCCYRLMVHGGGCVAHELIYPWQPSCALPYNARQNRRIMGRHSMPACHISKPIDWISIKFNTDGSPGGWCMRLITLPPSMSQLFRQCGILNISQLYRPPRTVTGIAFFLNFFLAFTGGSPLRVSG
jgi:hypothetical protein